MAKRNLTPPKNFEDGLAELEQILVEMEGGQIMLEDSLVKFERGNFLIQFCRSVLDSAEKQIELLSKSPDGGLQSAPMQPPREPASNNAPAGEAGTDPAS